MLNAGSEAWQPTKFKRWVDSIPTSTGPAIIVTDEGQALIKALGNKEGPHALACEWIGTKLAIWLGLATFDIAIMKVAEDDEIPLGHGRMAKPGPAVVTRWEEGEPWQNDAKSLAEICNPEVIPGMVVLDTWIRNPDRYPPATLRRRPNPDNVFLSVDRNSAGSPTLKAIDHTTCMACGKDLTVKVAHLETIDDDAIYGLFPAFHPFVTRDAVRPWIARLGQFDLTFCQGLVDGIPMEWSVTTQVRMAIVELLSRRAKHVSETIEELIRQQLECETGTLWL